jgi:HAD superfamily hydrolase (TIGR01509 family)
MQFREERLLVFDCDGVLVDSEILVTQIEVELLAAAGVPMTVEDVIATCVGLSDAEMHRRIEQRWKTRLPHDFVERKRARIAATFEAALRPVPGIPELLDHLSGPRCVASSSEPKRLRRSLELTELIEEFTPHLFSAAMVERGKPAPDLFLHAAAAMGASPERSIVIEDSPPGVAAGRAAGMTVIGFTGASHCQPGLPSELEHAGAHEVACDASALLGLLQRL